MVAECRVTVFDPEQPVGFLHSRRLRAYHIAGNAGRLNEKRGNRPMNDVQHRREQLGMDGEKISAASTSNRVRQASCSGKKPRPLERNPTSCAAMPAGVDHALAIDQHVADAGGKLVRIIKRGLVDDLLVVKDDNVGS